MAKESPVRNVDKLLLQATEAQRMLILEVKQVKIKEAWPVDSTAVYRAILENGLNDLESVRNYLLETNKINQ